MSVIEPSPVGVGAPASPVRKVRVRLLPWRPRWRSIRDTGPEFGLDGFGDDPISAVLGLIVLVILLPFVLAALFGVALLSLEMLLLLPLGVLAMLGQLCGLRPWVLTVIRADGGRSHEEVRGTRAMWRRRRELLGGG